MIEGGFLVVHGGYSLQYFHVTVANPKTKSLQRAFPLQNLHRRLSASHDIVATTLLWVCPLPYRSASAFWIVTFKFVALGGFAKGTLLSSPFRAFFRLLVILRYIPYFVIWQMSQHSMRYGWTMRIECTVKILEERLAAGPFIWSKF